jgi:hypothetical protein
MNLAHTVFEFVFFFFVQPNFEVEMPEIERGWLPKNTTGAQIPRVSSEPDSPDRCA